MMDQPKLWISIIVAAAQNNAIGKNNDLLWHLPNDMRFFKNTTWGMPVIMGRKTFESFKKALRGRLNVVITRSEIWQANGAEVAAGLEDAIDKAKLANTHEIFIAGGGEIYKQAMQTANRIYLTRVHSSFDADTFFPEFSEADWQLVKSKDFEADEKNKYAYSFQTWERK